MGQLGGLEPPTSGSTGRCEGWITASFFTHLYFDFGGDAGRPIRLQYLAV